MRVPAFAAFGLVLAGCASTAPAPNFVNGYYYMTGDAGCVAARNVSPTRIACFDASGRLTGQRDAMTPEQIQMYQFQAMQQQMQMQQMQQSIDYNNAMMAANTRQTLDRAAVYSPPVAEPVQISGGNRMHCIGVGIYANCRW